MFIVLRLYPRIWNLFCTNPSHPFGPHAIRRTEKLLNCQTTRWVPILMGSNQKQRCGFEFAKWYDIYTSEECAEDWRQNNADSKLLCHEWFHHVRHHVHDGHCNGEFAIQFHSVVPWWRPRRTRPQRTRLSQPENSTIGTWPIYKKCHAILVRKMAWYKILMSKFCIYLEWRYIFLIDDTQNMQNKLNISCCKYHKLNYTNSANIISKYNSMFISIVCVFRQKDTYLLHIFPNVPQ